MGALEIMIPAFRSALVLVLLASACSAAEVARSESAEAQRPVNGPSLYLKVRLDSPLNISKLKPGDQVSGKLLQDVYCGVTQVFPALSEVRLTVDRLEKRPRIGNDHWPWVMKAFAPRHEQWPVFHIARVTNADGSQVALEVSLVSLNKEVEVEPKPKKNSGSARTQVVPSARTRRELGGLVTLIASTQPVTNSTLSATVPPEFVAIPAGTEARVILLRDISASRNHASDSFQARLVQPVFLDSRILLPEGTLFEGNVLKSQAPRSLSRSGSISLAFTKMRTPDGTGSSIAASVAGAQINHRSHTVIDSEGRMHGDRAGKAWMLVNVGSTAGIAKEVDDGTQLIVEALMSTATDASTAGTARIVSTCVSAVFLLTRHGRDVMLPKYTQMKIVFDRPAYVSNENVRSAIRN
jgi:hypothetical protein